MFRLVLINILVFLSLFFVCDYMVGLFEDSFYEEESLNYYQEDPQLGYRPKANVTVHIKKITQNNEVIYRTTYSFDKYHRRVTPQSERTREKFLIFVGDSNTFGEGLNNNETLPYEVAQLLPDYRVYNYAYRGYGPNNVMALLDSDKFPEEVIEQEGLLVYPFGHYQAGRLIGTLNMLRWSQGHHPYYDFDKTGRLVRNGTFISTRPIWFRVMKFIAKLHTLNFLGINYPDSYDENNFKKLCTSFLYIKKQLRQTLPKAKLLMVLEQEPPELKRKITSCWLMNKIEFMDISEIYNEKKESWYLHLKDRHFSHIANKRRGSEIARQLKEKGF